MQSKLPVRIKKPKSVNSDKKRCCCCAQLLKIIIENPIDYPGKIQENINLQNTESKSTQTKSCEFFMESEKKAFQEMKSLLISVNVTLEQILKILQIKKEYLYNKLQEEASIKPKNSIKYTQEKNKKKNVLVKKQIYTWPEINGFYMSQTPWFKQYPQRLFSANSTINIFPRRIHPNWMCSKPMSCSDISYFKPIPMQRIQNAVNVSIRPLSCIGHGDFKNYKNHNKISCNGNIKESNSDLDEHESDKEVQ